MESQGDDLNDHVHQANANVNSWAAECEKTVALPTLERYVEVEISVVTQKYDKFGRLISETIENLKIKLRETKQKEVRLLISFGSSCGHLRSFVPALVCSEVVTSFKKKKYYFFFFSLDDGGVFVYQTAKKTQRY